jgi:cellulose biosynthesis protein BcsQ
MPASGSWDVHARDSAINLAACLAEAGERVLLVDFYPQANETSGLGERANGPR